MSVIEQKIVLKAVDEASRNIKAVSDSAKKGSEEVIRANEKTKLSYDSLKGAIGLTAGAFTAVSAVAVLAGKALVDTEIQVNRIEKALKIYTGSMAGASSEIAFLKDQSKRLGLEFSSTALAYSQLAVASKGTAITSSEVKDIFVATSEAGSALGLSAYDVEGALRAMQQMMSKGTVQAEELRGQLGERIPGAFTMASKAMGVTERELGKMLERGEVMASDLLPKLAKELHTTFGPEAEAGAKGMAGQVNSLKNAFFDLKEEFLSGGASTLLTGIFEAGTRAVKDYSDAIKLALGGEIAKLGQFTSDFGKKEIELSENLVKSQAKWKEAGKVKFTGEFLEAQKAIKQVMGTEWVDNFLKKSNKEQGEYIEKLKITNSQLASQEQAIIKTEETKKKSLGVSNTTEEKAKAVSKGLSPENERIKEAYEIDRIIAEINEETTQKILEEEQARVDSAREIDDIIAEINQETTKRELEESNKRIEQAKREKDLKRGLAFDTASTVISTMKLMAGTGKKYALLNKTLAIADIGVNTARSVMQAISSPPGPPWTIPLASAIGVMGAVQIGKASQAKFAATGADFITNGPQLMVVGENSGGREHVQVTPMSSPNVNGPKSVSNNNSFGNINITVQNGGDLISMLESNPDRFNKLLKNGLKRGAFQGVV